MNRDYIVAYRKGAARHAGSGSQVTGGSQSFDEMMRSLSNDKRAENSLREALEGNRQRDLKTGKTRIPRSDVKRVAKGLGRALKRHPVLSALKAALSVLEQSGQGNVYWNMPGMGSQGACPIVDALDYSDQRAGLPSTNCNTGQAVGEDYGAHQILGVGHWVKRAVGFNYNQLHWWLPGSLSTAEMAALFDKSGWIQNETSGMANSAPKLDPQTNPQIDGSQVGDLAAWQAHPHADPGAGDVRAEQPYPIALPTVLVTNRTGVGPGVGGEQSSWTSSDPADQSRAEKLTVARSAPATRFQKERKAHVAPWLYHAMGLLTEELDAVAALYPCIPKKLRTAEFKGRRLQVSLEEKAKAVYQHWDQINLGCAAFNLLWERVEDSAYAKASKATKAPKELMKGRRSIAGGRSLQVSQQGDADLPHGQLPLADLKKWLQAKLGLEGT